MAYRGGGVFAPTWRRATFPETGESNRTEGTAEDCEVTSSNVTEATMKNDLQVIATTRANRASPQRWVQVVPSQVHVSP
jgi:hypothetical protein